MSVFIKYMETVSLKLSKLVMFLSQFLPKKKYKDKDMFIHNQG